MNGEFFRNKVDTVLAFIKRTALCVWQYMKIAKMEMIILVSAFSLDLISKAVVEAYMEYGDTVTMIPYVLNAHRWHNYDAAFGASFLNNWFGAVGARIFFCVFAVATSVAFVLMLIRQKGKSKIFRIALALFVAGAMGNCIDRMVFGYVRDFFEFIYLGMTIGGKTTWPYIFNLADAELVIGVGLIIIYFLFIYKDTDKNRLEPTIESETNFTGLQDAVIATDGNNDDTSIIETEKSNNAATPIADDTDNSDGGK